MARHRNGHVREKALPYLAQLGTYAAIVELLHRANDWVPEVRHAARTALQSRQRELIEFSISLQKGS